MVKLTRINHQAIVINADLIEHVEVTPDTVVTMSGGQKFVVLEPAEEVIQRVIEYRRMIVGGALALYQPWSPAERAAQESGGADGR
jgi:flagellar protein FlbD